MGCLPAAPEHPQDQQDRKAVEDYGMRGFTLGPDAATRHHPKWGSRVKHSHPSLHQSQGKGCKCSAGFPHPPCPSSGLRPASSSSWASPAPEAGRQSMAGHRLLALPSHPDMHICTWLHQLSLPAHPSLYLPPCHCSPGHLPVHPSPPRKRSRETEH